ncbi:ORF V: Enzymatic polyprotein [Labeo rohita]|uniref:ORF V: Enzymatic polyprotein n=1 Tax=Labeo rohita TaxID=84645 RepID=A0ABQ8LA51_LABRO|nr:ORF V: Enzymatic polyprotein [Labeo rohita]
MTADLHPSPGAQDMVSFGAMEDAEEGDDAISVAASEREEWSNSPLEYTAPHGSDAGDLHHGDVELLRVLTKAVKELGMVWAPPAEPTRSRLDKWYLQSDRGRKDTPRRPGPFFPEVHDEIAKSWNVLLTSRVHNPGSFLLSSVDGADRAGYAKLPPVEEAVAAHLCPAAATNWRVRNNASLPSKPCRATANFAGKAFSTAGQAASALHVMAILQVYQAKLLKSLDEGGPDPEVFKELRRATDLALRMTKMTARAIGRSMGNLVVLDRHLWLTLTELKDSEKTALLDAPVDPSGLFGAAVETFTERFAEAQKQYRAISHFLPKRASMNPPARSRSSSAQRAASARPEQEPTARSPRDPAPAETAGLRRRIQSRVPVAVSRRRKTTSSAEDEPLKKPARSTNISFLGVELDSINMRARLTKERTQKLVSSLSVFKMAAASTVCKLGLLHMRPLQLWLKSRVPQSAWRAGSLRVKVTHEWLDALTPWRDMTLYCQGVPIGQVIRRKTVTTDASSTGWGAVCDGRPAFGTWTETEKFWHINCLELRAVHLALECFLPDILHRHVLIRTDSTTVVAFINHQGGVSSRPLMRLAKDLLLWADQHLLPSQQYMSPDA